MKLYDGMECVLPRVIEGEAAPENPHELGFGGMRYLPNKPALQFDFEIGGGASHRVVLSR